MMRRPAALALVATGLIGLSACFSSPAYHGRTSDHFDGERFFNPAHRDAFRPGPLDFIRWRLTREPGIWPDWVPAEPGPPPPARVGPGDLRVTWVNHATMLLQLDGVNVLSDPIWSDVPGPVDGIGPHRVRPPGIRFEDLPPVHAVIVSHNHYDHMDVPTLKRLAVTHRPAIFVGLGNKALLDGEGIPGGVDLDWWESADLETPDGRRLRVTSVPTRHSCLRGATDLDRALWSGFVLSSAAGSAYFAGDTGYGPHFAEIGRRMGPIRLACLPIGAYLPRWFMHPAHISPAEAVQAHIDLGARTSVAMHFGTFPLGDDGETEPVVELDRALAALADARAPGALPRFWVLGFGEGRAVP